MRTLYVISACVPKPQVIDKRVGTTNIVVDWTDTHREKGASRYMPFAEADLPTNLKRVIALNGTDEGFYVLALHSLIEGYAKVQAVYKSTLDTFERKAEPSLESERVQSFRLRLANIEQRLSSRKCVPKGLSQCYRVIVPDTSARDESDETHGSYGDRKSVV